MLKDTGLVRLLYPQASGNQLLTKPEKIFLHNSTLLWALNQLMSEKVLKGMQRECFFAQSVMDAGITVHYSKQGDFAVNDIIFEIGGRNKTPQQIISVKQPAFLVKDDVLYATQREIPLWCFGFLY